MQFDSKTPNFSTICTNQARCAKARCQKEMDHDGCDMIICTDTATWGPVNTKNRIYCQRCATQLTKQGTIQNYTCNSSKCMNGECAVDNKSKIKYGARGTKAATVCSECAKSLKFVVMGTPPCEMVDDDNQYICRTQFKRVVSGKHYCGKHATQIERAIQAEIIEPEIIEPEIIAPEEPKPIEEKKSPAKNKADYCPRCPKETASAKMYGWQEDGRKMFCRAHKEDGMINVISKRCDYDLGPDETEEKGDTVSNSNGALPEPRLCGKIAQYGADRAHRCADHKENLNRLVNACKQDNCNDRRTYGHRNRETGKGKMQYCESHKHDGMIDVSHRLCHHITNGLYDCDYRASFPEIQDGPEMFCADHNANSHHDVTHKKCSEVVDGIRCHTRAAYGYAGKGNGHRGTPEKCFDHRGDRINVVVDRCIRCHFGTQQQVKANQAKRKHLCSTCYRLDKDSDPDALEKFNKKEKAIRISIQEHPLIQSISNVDQLITYDKAVGGGCRSRPDILIKLSTHNVIVEIDENQHNRECYSDDDARIIEIQYALESKPLIVIRFNPDQYKTESGICKKGLFIKSTNDIALPKLYSNAIDELVDLMFSAINSIPVTPIKTMYLRYTPDKLKKKP